MSAFIGLATTDEIALSAATAKTVLQLIAPTNHRLKLLRWKVSFDGISTTAEPVKVVLMRQTTAGTMTSLTIRKADDSIAETLQATAQHTATAEPTSGEILDAVDIHPQSGYESTYNLGQEDIVGGGDRVGIVCTAPAGVNVIAQIRYEE
jgi:hypothetical protein